MSNNPLKNYLTKLIKLLGYRLIPEWRYTQISLAEHLRSLFIVLNIKCVIDVGGNRGQYRDFLRMQVGYDGLIITFEPIKSLASNLQLKARNDSQWIIYPFALGSKNDTLQLNVMKSDVFSSFLKPDSTTINDFDNYNIVNHIENVIVMKLDDLLVTLQSKWEKNIYLKIDTQGFDLEVLKGAEKTLEHVAALQSEISCLQIYSGMPDFITSLNFFLDKGFEISGLFPVSRDKSMRVIEFDYVGINKAFRMLT